MRRAALLAAVLLPALALAQPLPPKYLPFKMLNGASDPFKYYLDNRNPSPAGLSMTSVQAATTSAWGKWNNVTCAVPKTTLVGNTSGVVLNPPDPYDAFSVTPVWITSTSDMFFLGLFGGTYVKATTLALTYAGELNRCDIYANGVPGISWSVGDPTPTGSVDLETVMLHEAGHCLGLDHFGDSAFPTVMQGAIEEGFQRRQLTQYDISALCDRNALQGAIGSPCLADGGCGSTVPGIKCITQPLGTGSAKFCTIGCQTGTGFVCDVPLYCDAATFFNPTFSGACLRAVNTVTAVGAPCTANNQCSSAVGLCNVQDVHPSGLPRWAQGYCSQSCAIGQPPCPAGAQCTDVGGANPICLKSCRVGLADCRPGYSCAQSVNGGVCVPSCYQDVDCGNSALYQCRTCDGLCVDRQNTSGQIGDLCSQDQQCGAGQLCASPGLGQKLCTLSCGVGCGNCPTGSTCHPIPPSNALFCLRTCTGPGTCPTGTRCANLSTGRACVGACINSNECPVGQDCVNGDCFNPGENDGGCEPFCTMFDAGKPITPKKDAGTGGGGGSGGCGCASTADLSGLFALVLVLWVQRLRRTPAPARQPERRR